MPERQAQMLQRWVVDARQSVCGQTANPHGSHGPLETQLSELGAL